MQINILPTAAGFVVEVSNYPNFNRYVRYTTYEVQELITELLKPEGKKEAV